VASWSVGHGAVDVLIEAGANGLRHCGRLI
jgi:hypothetical protein